MSLSKPAAPCGITLMLALAGPVLADAGAEPARVDGDIGLGVFSRQAILRGDTNDASVLPYVFATWGRAFGRIDTFGVKTLAAGYGHVEISTRVMQDGFAPNAATAGVAERKASRPLGLSTFQVTPWGAVSLVALRDLGDSDGVIVDANWTGKVRVASWLTLYPQGGAEHLSARYVDYRYGVRAGEGGFTPYRAGSALNPYLAIYTETPLSTRLTLQMSWRQKWLGGAIADSPLVTESRRWNGYAAVAYRFR